MTFAFICDSYFQKKVSSFLVLDEVPNHKIITITADEFLQAGKLPDGVEGIIVERGTWQKNFSLFRYFNLLPILESLPIAFVANTNIAGEIELKGRIAIKNKDLVIPHNLNAEEISLQLQRFSELPPLSYAHPKSRAIA